MFISTPGSCLIFFQCCVTFRKGGPHNAWSSLGSLQCEKDKDVGVFVCVCVCLSFCLSGVVCIWVKLTRTSYEGHKCVGALYHVKSIFFSFTCSSHKISQGHGVSAQNVISLYHFSFCKNLKWVNLTRTPHEG